MWASTRKTQTWVYIAFFFIIVQRIKPQKSQRGQETRTFLERTWHTVSLPGCPACSRGLPHPSLDSFLTTRGSCIPIPKEAHQTWSHQVTVGTIQAAHPPFTLQCPSPSRQLASFPPSGRHSDLGSSSCHKPWQWSLVLDPLSVLPFIHPFLQPHPCCRWPGGNFLR